MTAAGPDITRGWSPSTEFTTVLCDADGTLFPSEDPAFEASAVITRQLAERYGIPGDFSAEGLRRAATGRNFRATANALLEKAGVDVDSAAVEQWIDLEKRAVTAHLSDVLTVDVDVCTAVSRLAQYFDLAVVTSSARSRLDACLAATGLAERFLPERRFSAEDSLSTPVSKPDPAVYLHALRTLGIDHDRAIAIEDSAAGIGAAVRAGIAAVGIVAFVAEDERPHRVADLFDAGAANVAETWDGLVDRLLPAASRC